MYSSLLLPEVSVNHGQSWPKIIKWKIQDINNSYVLSCMCSEKHDETSCRAVSSCLNMNHSFGQHTHTLYTTHPLLTHCYFGPQINCHRTAVFVFIKHICLKIRVILVLLLDPKVQE